MTTNGQDDTRYNTAVMGDMTVGEYANGLPNIRLSEMVKGFGRQLIWVIPLMLIGTGAAYKLTEDFKRTYSGDGRIMVQLGEEYIYQPIGDNTSTNGLMTTIDTITLSETAIMKNAEVMDQVIGEMTSPRVDRNGNSLSKKQAEMLFAKDKFDNINGARSKAARDEAYMELRKEVESSYVVMARPKSSIIDIVYKHENPDVAVDTLNAFIDAYLSYRRTIFVEGSGDAISDRRAATELQLNQNERAIARFLERNNISDFDSERGGLRKRSEDTKAELNKVRAQIAESEAALAKTEDTLRDTPETIDLYRDDRAAQRVAQAELEMQQLLAKYLPTADPVRQKERELNELRQLQASYGGKASGGRRVGPNTVHQLLLTKRSNLAATANSLREKEYTLQQQLNSADSKVRKLTKLNPEYQNLLRERDTLSARLKSYNAKEQEALINADQSEASAENVKVISYAKYPNKGRNMRMLMFLIATVGWGLTLFIAAMLRVFLDPRLYAVPSRRQPAVAPAQPVADQLPQVDQPGIIPEPVAPYAPAPLPYEQPYAPAAHTQGQGQAQGWDATPYADPNGYPQDAYAQDVYAQPSYATTDPYAAPTTGYAGDEYAQPQYSQGMAQPLEGHAFQGNAALDLSHNPYATGQVQAGSFEDQPAYQQPTPPPYTT